MEVKMEIKLEPTDIKEGVITNTEAEGYRLIEESVRGEDTYLVFRNFNLQEWLDNNIIPIVKRLLKDSDEMMLYDIVEDMSPEEYIKWKAYRKALRDLPASFSGATRPPKVVWPEKPIKI
jgi:hypothetical protein